MDKHEHELKNRIGVVLEGGCFYNELSMKEMKSIVAQAYSSWNERDYKNYKDIEYKNDSLNKERYHNPHIKVKELF